MDLILYGDRPLEADGEAFCCDPAKWPNVRMLVDFIAPGPDADQHVARFSEGGGLSTRQARALAEELDSSLTDGTLDAALSTRAYRHACQRLAARMEADPERYDSDTAKRLLARFRWEGIPPARTDIERFITFLKACGGYFCADDLPAPDHASRHARLS